MNTLKVDLHLHTSEDPADIIPHDSVELIDRAAELGYDALALTLHDRQFTSRDLTEYARDRGILLLPGIERTIAGRHVVLVNFPAAAESVESFDDLRRLKARSNGLVIAPHPFFPGTTCLGSSMDAHVSLIDVVEWSYFWTWGANFNARAARWAERYGKPMVGNSDLHDLRQLGRTYSRVQAEERSPEGICDAIRRGRVVLHTQPVPLPELAVVFGGIVWRGQKRRTVQPAPAALANKLQIAGE